MPRFQGKTTPFAIFSVSEQTLTAAEARSLGNRAIYIHCDLEGSRPIMTEPRRPPLKAAVGDQDCRTSKLLSWEAMMVAEGSCGRSNSMRRSKAVERIMG
jgi:hypothetical protein